MLRLQIFTLLLLSVLSGKAQTSAVLFTEKGETFYADINGVRVNEKAVASLRITDLKEDFYPLRIILLNTPGGKLESTLALTPGQVSTYSIRKNNNGEFVLRYLGTADVQGKTADQLTISYQSRIPAISDPVVAAPSAVSPPQHSDESDIETFVVSTSPESSCETTDASGLSVQLTTSDYPKNYNGIKGCDVAINYESFKAIKSAISAISSEEERVKAIKNVLEKNCFYSVQIKELCELVSFEDSRLEIAKAAYAHTFDLANYTIVNNVFNFDTSVEELGAYKTAFGR